MLPFISPRLRKPAGIALTGSRADERQEVLSLRSRSWPAIWL
jgi:hypothetical protein